MAYVTTKDLEAAAGGEDRLRQISKNDPARIAKAIARAEATAHKHLGRLYGVPMVDPVSDDIKELIAEEAVFHLMRRSGMVAEAEQVAHEERTKEFEAYGRGEVAAPPGATKAAAVRNASSSPSDDRAVSRDALKGFA